MRGEIAEAVEVERTDLRGHEVDEDAGARRHVLLAQMADEVTKVVRRPTGQATHERAAAQMIASLAGRQLAHRRARPASIRPLRNATSTRSAVKSVDLGLSSRRRSMAIPGYFARNSRSSGATTFSTKAHCRADPQHSVGRTAALVAHAVERLPNQFHAGMAMLVGQLAFVRASASCAATGVRSTGLRLLDVAAHGRACYAEPVVCLGKLLSLTTAMNAITPA